MCTVRRARQVDAEGGIETDGRVPQTRKRIRTGALAGGIFGAILDGGCCLRSAGGAFMALPLPQKPLTNAARERRFEQELERKPSPASTNIPARVGRARQFGLVGRSRANILVRLEPKQ